MGDVVGLVEKAAETMDAEKAEKIAARMKKGQFTLDDMAEQIKTNAGHGRHERACWACCPAWAK